MKQDRQRNTGLEILRILSMFLIILLHSIDHSGLLERLVPGTFLYTCEMFFYALTQVCVNCFVMISGYFLVNSKFKIQKLIQLWIEVVFYSFFIKLILMLIGSIPFSIVSLFRCFLPVMTGRYWFVTIYFGLYLLSPFLNIAIHAMNQKQHRNLNLLLMLLMSLMVSISPSFAGMNSGDGWGVAWFVVLYLSAAYLRLYWKPLEKIGVVYYWILYVSCAFIMWSAVIVTNYFFGGAISEIAENWYRYDSIWVYMGTLALFCAFLQWEYNRKEKYPEKQCPRWLSSISGATFGVYLIHAHANICIELVWRGLKLIDFMDYIWFPLYQIILVCGILLVCALVDMGRQKLFQVIKINKMIDKISSKL